MRVLVAAFGDAGHVFPAIGLGRELAGRGHEVIVETWEQRRAAVEHAGLGFRAAEAYTVFPPPDPDSGPGRTAVEAARALGPLLDEFRPDVVVCDILTQAPMLAAEVAGVPLVTLVPHVFPEQEPGLPLYSLGFMPARTPVGRLLWRSGLPLVNSGLRRGRDDLNRTRAELGLGPLDRFHGGTSDRLALVATFPQLEYPRRWPEHVKVTGPVFFEMPYPDVELPPGDGPLVLVAPSTAHDPNCHLLRAALDGLADLPVRVLATTNRHRPSEPIEVPDNAVLEPWLSYSQAMEVADVVICHGGHGTVARALAAGKPVLVCPAVGDMAENGARAQWAGAGLMVPRRLLSPGSVRIAAKRLLAEGRFGERAREIAAWSAENDGAERAADLVEEMVRNEASRRAPARG